MKDVPRRVVLQGLAGSAAALASARAADTIAGPGDINLARAKTEGKVVLYTSLDTQIVDAINAAFTAKYGIPVEYFRGGSADVTSKVLAEADASRIQADVVDASDLAALLVMKDRGLLKPFRSVAAAAIGARLQDPGGTWIADRLTQCVLQYNTNEFGAKPPAHWVDLTQPAYRGRLAFFSSANGDGAPRLYTLAKAFGWDLLKAYAANKPLRVQTPQVITQVLESGERGAAFLTNDNIAWRSKRQGRPTDYVFPTEGVPTEPGAFGLLKASTRPNAAMLFYEWWMGREGQEILVKGGKYSSRADIAPPEGAPPLSSLKLITLDYAEYKRDRTKILQQMTDIFGGEWGV